MKRYITVCVILAVVFSVYVSCGKKQETGQQQNDAKIIFAIGEVQVKTSDKWDPAAEQMRLVQGSEIKTGAQSECNLQIGTDSFITVKENSHLIMATLLRDVAGLEENTLELRVGKGVVNPKKLLKGDSFNVKTPTAIAAVRGTKFVVQTDPTGEMKVAVVDGKVELKRRIPALEQLEQNIIQKSETLTELKQKVDQESIIVDANQSAFIDNVKTQAENNVIEQAVEKHIETLKEAEEKAIVPQPSENVQGKAETQAVTPEVKQEKSPELVKVDKSLSAAFSGLEIMQTKKKDEVVQIKLEEKVEKQDVQDVKQLDTVIQENHEKVIKQEKVEKSVTRLTIVSPVKGSSIFVNGKLAAYDSATLTPDADKNLKVLVTARGYAPFETTTVMKEGEQKQIQVQFLANGKLTIVAPVPNSQIYVDDRKVGNNSVTVEQAPGMTVTVRISARDFKDYSEQVLLQPGESKNITPVMERNKALDRIKWSKKMGTDIASTPVFFGNYVIVASIDGYVTAVTNEGQNIWRANLKRRIESTPAVVQGRVYVVTNNGEFFALSLASGETLWKQKMFGSLLFGASPLVVKDRIYCATSYGRVYAFSEDGKELWIRDIENGIYTSPAYDEGRLYFGAEDYNLYSISTEKGEIEWKFKADSRTVGSSPVISGNRLYFGCYSGNFYAVDKNSGREVWKFKAGDSILSTALVRDEALYFGSNDGNLYSLASADGSVRWKFHSGSRVTGTPAFDNGLVYMTSGKRLYAIDPGTGAAQWSYDFAGKVKTSATVSGNDIYIGLDNGEVASVRNSLFNVYR